MSFPFYKQFDIMDCGPTCLRIISKFYGKELSLQSLREKCQIQRDGVSLLGISRAAELIGMQTLAVKIGFEDLKQNALLPCIVHWDQSHFIVVYRISEKYVWVADPGKSKLKLSKSEFIDRWLSVGDSGDPTGIVLLVEPTENFLTEDSSHISHEKRFWDIFQRFKKYKKLFLQIFGGILLGAVLQALLPFLSKAIVDVGIVNKDLNFISLVLIGQILVLVGSLTTDFVKSWILLYISQRVNIELMTSFFIKLMRLPISFFDTKLTGDIILRLTDHNRLQGFV
ncbi:MAG: cysteine peptidase family C39 domain-containing protein, partial [Sediminibacterium sp.]